MARKIILFMFLLMVSAGLLCTDVTISPFEDPVFDMCLKAEVSQLVFVYPKAPTPGLYEVFELAYIPKTTPVEFLTTKIKNINLPISTYVRALIYIDRLVSNAPGIFDGMTFYKIFLTALVIAAKMDFDDFNRFAMFAVLAGIRVQELYVAEIAFLEAIKYDLDVSDEAFYEKVKQIMESGGQCSEQ